MRVNVSSHRKVYDEVLFNISDWCVPYLLWVSHMRNNVGGALICTFWTTNTLILTLMISLEFCTDYARYLHHCSIGSQSYTFSLYMFSSPHIQVTHTTPNCTTDTANLSRNIFRDLVRYQIVVNMAPGRYCTIHKLAVFSLLSYYTYVNGTGTNTRLSAALSKGEIMSPTDSNTSI